MSLKKIHEKLYQIWERVNHIGGWLRILGLSGDYSEEELRKLEEIDEEAITTKNECQDQYYQIEPPRVKAQIEEFKKRMEKEYGKDWIKERRLEYLEGKLKAINQRIKQSYNDFFESLKSDIPFWLRQALLEIKKTQELEKLREKIEEEIYLLKFKPEIEKGRITEFEIERALSFPFKDLIQANQMKMAICPFHPDKRPSFWIKNNWGYCFGCNWHGDTIKFLMERDNLSFTQTVKALQ